MVYLPTFMVDVAKYSLHAMNPMGHGGFTKCLCLKILGAPPNPPE